MSWLLPLVRQIVQEELALHRGPRLATVSTVHPHESADDTANYEADVVLKHDGLELKRVPIAVSHVGVAAAARIGDLVLVQFLDGDLQQPLITGRFYHDDDRAPLFAEDDVLYEHRLPDGTLNHLRFAADGTILIQRDVTTPADNSECMAGIRIDPDGVIEVRTGDKVVLTLKDGEVDVRVDGGPVKVSCDEFTVDGKLTVTQATSVKGELRVGQGTDTTTIKGTEIIGGPV